MKIAYIDIETTGLDPEQDQILEIGCIIDNLLLPDDQIRPTFNCYVNHERIIGNPFALSMNKDILERLAKPQTSEIPIFNATSIARNLSSFLFRNLDDTVTIGGKNVVVFDLPFLYKLPECSNHRIGAVKIRHRTVDPAILYMLPSDETVPDMQTCCIRAGMPAVITHHALEDATLAMRLVRHKLCLI